MLYDVLANIDKLAARKLDFKWLRPYRVAFVVPKKETYILEEFDDTKLKGTFPRNRLKVFVKRDGIYEIEDEKESDLDEEDSKLDLGTS